MSPRKHKQRRRRGRFPILYKVLSAVLILAAVLAACMIFFRVREVVVVGNVRYSQEEIVAMAGVSQGGNLFAVNKFELRKRLLTQLPYIDRVEVKRKLPDTLVISVAETAAAGVIAGEGDWWVLDADGKLLERRTTKPTEAYFLVTGIIPLAPAEGTYLAVALEERSRLTALLELMSALEKESLLAGTNAIDLTDGYQLMITYDGRFTIKVPALEDLPYRMRFFREGLESGRIAETGSYTVDMTLEGQTRFIPTG